MDNIGNIKKEKRICWITATYFLDVDLPIVPKLKDKFDIDWYIVTTRKSKESDIQYIQSQTRKRFKVYTNDYKFFAYGNFKFYNHLIKDLARKDYDLYYFDISDFLFLFPLINRSLPADRIMIATHNVSVPKGARFAVLARRSMDYIISHFNCFQVFSKNQENELLNRKPGAEIFYCPLMQKDYGKKGEYNPADHTRFLFFGNIIRYKRLDVLLEAINILGDKGIRNFRVDICGSCKSSDWKNRYLPLIKYPELVNCDIRRIPNEMVGDYFINNDYFVMPYQDIAQSGAMTVALNYNMPIIASELDTFKEFLTDGETGYFFKSGDSKDLARIMEKAINNTTEEYKRIKDNQKIMVDNTLTSEIIIGKYTEFLESRLNA